MRVVREKYEEFFHLGGASGGRGVPSESWGGNVMVRALEEDLSRTCGPTFDGAWSVLLGYLHAMPLAAI